MADLNAWMEKAVNLTRAGVSKAKDIGEIARLNLDNVAEQEKVKQAYMEIGERYVTLHKTAGPEAGYEAMFRTIEEAQAKIRANKEKIAQIKEEKDIKDEDLVDDNIEVIALEETSNSQNENKPEE